MKKITAFRLKGTDAIFVTQQNAKKYLEKEIENILRKIAEDLSNKTATVILDKIGNPETLNKFRKAISLYDEYDVEISTDDEDYDDE